jgi:hypothetical protein
LGTGIRKGSFSPKFDAIGPKSIYSVYSDGRLDLNFRWLRHTESGRRAVTGLAKRLRETGFILPDDPGEKFVGMRPEAWVPRLAALKGALGELQDWPGCPVSIGSATKSGCPK